MTVIHRDSALATEVAIARRFLSQRRRAARTRTLGNVLMVLGVMLLASLVIVGAI
jgi:hypothetical protein